MDKYVTGVTIRRIREEKGITQAELAQRIAVSDKTISKWETGKGYPDITLLEPLAKALGISTIELLSGEDVKNGNRSSNMLRSNLYVCPVCGNTIHTMGKALISCCGITLPPLTPEAMDEEHEIRLERVEDEWFVTMDHPMTKDHYISFFAAVSDDHIQIHKLYPESNAEARFKISKVKVIYAYCNREGLFQARVNRSKGIIST